MPQENVTKPPKIMRKANIPRTQSHTEADLVHLTRSGGGSFSATDVGDPIDQILPPVFRSRLYELFSQIEREFESLYAENLLLQDKLESFNDRAGNPTEKQHEISEGADASVTSKGTKSKSGSISQKKKTTYKLKASTSKIVSSFKAPSSTCQQIRKYSGHRDGVWEIAVSRSGQNILGTASADQSARIWDSETGHCLFRYISHSGSVNSIKFHPSQDLVLTASGDQSAHIWRAMPININELNRAISSEEELESSEKDEYGHTDVEQNVKDHSTIIRGSLHELQGHSGVLICADWLSGGDQVITASWDRTANLYDTQTGQLLNMLAGHDEELTHICAHPTQRLAVTSSKDTTFRLWDFRETIHSVSVFQGHTDTVTSATFASSDKVVSGSDDRTVKVWDLKNMRSPLATINSDSPVNRLSVSSQNIIAIPHDNRQIRLFDLNGNRLARLPRSNRQGHQRMVTSVIWTDEGSTMKSNLFSSGFDRHVIGWHVSPSAKD